MLPRLIAAAVVLVAWLSVGPVSSSLAAVITHIGNDGSTAQAWRSTNVSKPLDIDGNNVYGTDGYMNQIGGTVTPAYLEFSFAASLDGSQNSVEYATGDDPTFTGSGPLPQLHAGNYFYSNSAANGEDDFFVIKLTQSGSFRLTVMNDVGNSNFGGQEAAVQVRVRQTVGGSADSGLINVSSLLNDQLDYYLFDISGVADDEFVISGVNDATLSENTLVGLAYDGFSAVPEPSTFALTALGTACYGWYSRRKSRRVPSDQIANPSPPAPFPATQGEGSQS